MAWQLIPEDGAKLFDLIDKACWGGSWEQDIEELPKLGYGPNSVDEDGKSPLHHAAASCEQNSNKVLELLLEKGYDLKAVDKDGKSPLHYAAAKDSKLSPEAVRLLLKRGVDPTQVDVTGMSSLHYAAAITGARFGGFEVVKLLLDEGVDPGVVDGGGRSPLHHAAAGSRGHSLKSVELLLQNGVDPKAVDKDGMSTLHYAAASDGNYSPEVVKLLLGNGVDPKAVDKDGKSTLHYAAAGGGYFTPSVVKLLLQNGVDPKAVDKDGKSTLHYVAASDGRYSLEVVELLLEKGVDPKAVDKDGKSTLHYAAARGWSYSLKVVKLLLEKGVDPKAVDKDGKSTLHYATASSGNHSPEVVKLLLEKGVDPKAVDKDGKSTLHYAAASGGSYSPEVVKLLLEKGVDPKAVDKDGKSTLHHVAAICERRSPEIVRLLLEKGVVPKAIDKDGNPPLSHAIVSSGEFSLEVLELLIEKGFDPKTIDKDGRSYLHLAVTRLLPQKEVVPKVVDSPIKSPFHYAAAINSHSSPHLVRLLVEKGVDPKTVDKNGSSPLHYAASSGNYDVCELFLSNGADADLQDSNRCTPLYVAILSLNEPVIGLLLKCSKYAGFCDSLDRTPIHWAIILGTIELLEQVFVRGINIHDKDKCGKSLLELAANEGHEDTVRFFIEKKVEISSPKAFEEAWRTVDKRGNDDSLSLAKLNNLAAIYAYLNRLKDAVDTYQVLLRRRAVVFGTVDKGALRLVLELEQLCKKQRLFEEARNARLMGLSARWEALWREPPALNIIHRYAHKDWLVSSFQNKEQVTEYLQGFENKAHPRRIFFTLCNARPSWVNESLFIFPAFARDGFGRNPDPICSDERLDFQICWTWSYMGLHRSQNHEFPSLETVKATWKSDGAYTTFQPHPHRSLGKNTKLERMELQKIFAYELQDTYISWNMVPHMSDIKSAPQEPDTKLVLHEPDAKPAQQNNLLFQSAEYFSAVTMKDIPDTCAHFVVDYLRNISDRWQSLLEMAHKHMGSSKKEVLRNHGGNKDVIKHLLVDADSWDSLLRLVSGHIHTSKVFFECIGKDGAIKLELEQHTKSSGESAELVAGLVEKEIAQLERYKSQLSEISKETEKLIQLEFNLVSIHESHESTRMATSMKRLSWITFVFLPLTFISSVFGMNVNTISGSNSNPGFKWYFISAVGLLAVVLGTWMIFKYVPIERKIEGFFEKCFRGRKDESYIDLEKGESSEEAQKKTWLGTKLSTLRDTLRLKSYKKSTKVL